ncbi:EF-P beta-lysylation protein EpmB [Candidatus Profftia sp. (ex Adelges kitamiensis)]|uniref:EF-P beta-lysylation protein EpmB n=1 Tax=Candidatus Profftia sp. (ex Adelges kitamiensis) TaxID=2864218 RepID=UPI001CE2B3BF|nr:EF-P beta-lysylation protein EpmB [Candidatus Profftia sp. (ex Adelges kitamiensis)]
MVYSFTKNYQSYQEGWLQQLTNAINKPSELLEYVELSNSPQLEKSHDARYPFSLRVPHTFARRIKKGDPYDPLLLQVMTSTKEFTITPGYSNNPVDEQNDIIVVPGLLHKYINRVLLLVKNNCAVHCRYCFRRYFPYNNNKGNKTNWRQALNYIYQHQELDEIIFSGGDPLMAKDHELSWLLNATEAIPHIKRLRIHTRLPVVIPDRITKKLINIFSKSRLNIILVTHINHAYEIGVELYDAMTQLKRVGVTLLNQSVLLRGINDNANTLADLSNALFSAGIIPYYLHLLDKVQGTAHFMVSDYEAQGIMRNLITKISGYMVPKLTREIGGEPSKTLIDLGLRQS